ncbi:toll/interleukin-1 receptor domain-containing protein [Pararhizobium sp. YC-54]|uniref:toll/interleukin-1 receptor domain-containing protein n=1 Tax=Pararhizobium sp. YC-54 TaxID=2986920 RepID=UPI0021F7B9DA|nr:toll/interleukin-1 receptor domain-containing protein [Pararhizobium sp. YC-54]MCV9999354.1 toll/interleukin-1 receptor domain-containing protein [Pararhizobium sp. YC-54]
MSISMYRSKVSRLEGQIADLRKKDALEAGREASYLIKANSAALAASKGKSVSAISLKLKEADRARKDAAASAQKRSGYAKAIASKSTELATARASLAKAEESKRAKAFKDIERQQNAQARRQKQLNDNLVSSMKASHGDRVSSPNTEAFDVFISHASEDKDEVVRELAAKARSAGLRVFYDEMTLKWGDSLRAKIDHGLANSRFGVVILSHAFFAKDWPKLELDGLFGREMQGKSKILPVWHKLTKDELMEKSPILGNKLALNTAIHTIDDIVDQLVSAVRD